MPKKPGKSPSAKRPAPLRLPRLTSAESDVFTHILNSAAFKNYGDCCGVEEIAKALDRTPGRMQAILNRLAKKGYLTIEGRIYPTVYPTVAALRRQDPQLGQSDAEKLLRQLHRA
jgi:hypothetical protein